jgi:hypothetical protein
MSIETLKIVICAFFMMLLASCASFETKTKVKADENSTNAEVDMSEDFSKAAMGIKQVSVLADVCFAEHMSALLLNESISADKELLAGIKTLLKKRGFTPVLCPAPYVGSYIIAEKETDVKTGTTLETKKPPFALPPVADRDNEYNNALMKIIASVIEMPNEKKDRNISFKPDENITKGLSIIAGKTGSDALLVVIGQAQVFARDENNKIIDKNSGTNFKNATTNAVQIVDLRTDDISSIAALIELKSNTVVWSNALRLNLPAAGKDYKTFFRDDFPNAILKDFTLNQ